jgi:acylphosphatase
MAGRTRFLVHGRVQGVGYRDFIRRAARSLDLHGTVRNLPDGSVEVEAAGTEDALAALEQAARQGPPGSRVEKVTRLPPTQPPLPSPFTITY